MLILKQDNLLVNLPSLVLYDIVAGQQETPSCILIHFVMCTWSWLQDSCANVFASGMLTGFIPYFQVYQHQGTLLNALHPQIWQNHLFWLLLYQCPYKIKSHIDWMVLILFLWLIYKILYIMHVWLHRMISLGMYESYKWMSLGLSLNPQHIPRTFCLNSTTLHIFPLPLLFGNCKQVPPVISSSSLLPCAKNRIRIIPNIKCCWGH